MTNSLVRPRSEWSDRFRRPWKCKIKTSFKIWAILYQNWPLRKLKIVIHLCPSYHYPYQLAYQGAMSLISFKVIFSLIYVQVLSWQTHAVVILICIGTVTELLVDNWNVTAERKQHRQGIGYPGCSNFESSCRSAGTFDTHLLLRWLVFDPWPLC